MAKAVIRHRSWCVLRGDLYILLTRRSEFLQYRKESVHPGDALTTASRYARSVLHDSIDIYWHDDTSVRDRQSTLDSLYVWQLHTSHERSLMVRIQMTPSIMGV